MYMICKVTYNTTIHTYITTTKHTYSVAKVDYRGVAAPKKDDS